MGKQDLSPGGQLAIGLACVATGIAIAAAGGQTLAVEHYGAKSAGLVAIPIGLTFACGGGLLLLPQRFERLRILLIAALLTAMAFAGDWVAFFPGERHFSGSFSVGGVGSVFAPGELVGRIVFGIGAVILDVVAIVVWVRILRSWFAVRQSDTFSV